MPNQVSVGSEVYNKYKELPNYSYNCISLLMNQSEALWKYLAYNDPDAWKSDVSHPNLTTAQKAALIYAGQEDETLFRVFMDTGQPDAWTKECTLIRISPNMIYPNNRTVGVVSMLFEVYSHYKVNTLSNYTTRIATISQLFLEVFNGAEIGGLGKLFFDRMGSFDNRAINAGQTPFKGHWLVLSTQA